VHHQASGHVGSICADPPSRPGRFIYSDEQERILDYPLMVYLCSGTDSEKLEWFKTIKIAGEKLTGVPQAGSGRACDIENPGGISTPHHRPRRSSSPQPNHTLPSTRSVTAMQGPTTSQGPTPAIDAMPHADERRAAAAQTHPCCAIGKARAEPASLWAIRRSVFSGRSAAATARFHQRSVPPKEGAGELARVGPTEAAAATDHRHAHRPTKPQPGLPVSGSSRATTSASRSSHVQPFSASLRAASNSTHSTNRVTYRSRRPRCRRHEGSRHRS
jgi:hypothetical protein